MSDIQEQIRIAHKRAEENDRKEYKKKYNKTYYELNKEKENKRYKEWYEKNKDKKREIDRKRIEKKKKELDDYKSRNEKAIEFLTTIGNYDEETKMFIRDLNYYDADKVLDILKGDNK